MKVTVEYKDGKEHVYYNIANGKHTDNWLAKLKAHPGFVRATIESEESE